MHKLIITTEASQAVIRLKEIVNESNKKNIIIDLSNTLSQKDLPELKKIGITKIKNISACALKLYYVSKLKLFLELTLPLLCRKTTTQKKISDKVIASAIKINKTKPQTKEHEIIRKLINTLCGRSALLNKIFTQNFIQANTVIVNVDTANRHDFYYLQIMLKLNTENTNSEPSIYILDVEGEFQKNASFAAILSNITNTKSSTTSPIHYITCENKVEQKIKPRFFENLKKPNTKLG